VSGAEKAESIELRAKSFFLGDTSFRRKPESTDQAVLYGGRSRGPRIGVRGDGKSMKRKAESVEHRA
jgi:hypothetical protein